MELANEGRVQYGARDVTVRMRIVSNMKRERTSLFIHRNIKSIRTGSASESAELHDVIGFRSKTTHKRFGIHAAIFQTCCKDAMLRVISREQIV
jgi:hypothetical protein